MTHSGRTLGGWVAGWLDGRVGRDALPRMRLEADSALQLRPEAIKPGLRSQPSLLETKLRKLLCPVAGFSNRGRFGAVGNQSGATTGGARHPGLLREGRNEEQGPPPLGLQ